MQDRCLDIESGNNSVDVRTPLEKKVCDLQFVMNAREVQGLAQNIRPRPLAPESGLTLLLTFKAIWVRKCACPGLQRAVGVEEVLDRTELAQAGGKPHVKPRPTLCEQFS